MMDLPFLDVEPETMGEAAPLRTPIGQYLTNEFETGWHGSALNSLMRMGQYHASEAGDSRMLQADEANKSWGVGDLKFDSPIKENTARILNQRKRAEMDRQYFLSHGSSALRTIPGMAAGMIGGMLNPVDLAIAFIPFVGEEAIALKIAKAGGGAARQAIARGLITREALAEVGAPGVVGHMINAAGFMAVDQVPNLIASAQDHADFGGREYLMGIGFNAALVGVLHPMARLLKRLTPETKEAIVREQVNAFLKDLQAEHAASFVKLDERALWEQSRFNANLAEAEALKSLDMTAVKADVKARFQEDVEYIAVVFEDGHVVKAPAGEAIHITIPGLLEYADAHPELSMQEGFLTDKGRFVDSREEAGRIMGTDYLMAEQMMKGTDPSFLSEQERTLYDLLLEEGKSNVEAHNAAMDLRLRNRDEFFFQRPEVQDLVMRQVDQNIQATVEKLRQDHDRFGEFSELRKREIQKQIDQGRVMPPEEALKRQNPAVFDGSKDADIEKHVKELKEELKPKEEKAGSAEQVLNDLLKTVDERLKDLDKPEIPGKMGPESGSAPLIALVGKEIARGLLLAVREALKLGKPLAEAIDHAMEWYRKQVPTESAKVEPQEDSLSELFSELGKTFNHPQSRRKFLSLIGKITAAMSVAPTSVAAQAAKPIEKFFSIGLSGSDIPIQQFLFKGGKASTWAKYLKEEFPNWLSYADTMEAKKLFGDKFSELDDKSRISIYFNLFHKDWLKNIGFHEHSVESTDLKYPLEYPKTYGEVHDKWQAVLRNEAKAGGSYKEGWGMTEKDPRYIEEMAKLRAEYEKSFAESDITPVSEDGSMGGYEFDEQLRQEPLFELTEKGKKKLVGTKSTPLVDELMSELKIPSLRTALMNLSKISPIKAEKVKALIEKVPADKHDAMVKSAMEQATKQDEVLGKVEEQLKKLLTNKESPDFTYTVQSELAKPQPFNVKPDRFTPQVIMAKIKQLPRPEQIMLERAGVEDFLHAPDLKGEVVYHGTNERGHVDSEGNLHFKVMNPNHQPGELGSTFGGNLGVVKEYGKTIYAVELKSIEKQTLKQGEKRTADAEWNHEYDKGEIVIPKGKWQLVKPTEMIDREAFSKFVDSAMIEPEIRPMLNVAGDREEISSISRQASQHALETGGYVFDSTGAYRRPPEMDKFLADNGIVSERPTADELHRVVTDYSGKKDQNMKYLVGQEMHYVAAIESKTLGKDPNVFVGDYVSQNVSVPIAFEKMEKPRTIFLAANQDAHVGSSHYEDVQFGEIRKNAAGKKDFGRTKSMLAWMETHVVTMPDGRRVLHVFEAQSDVRQSFSVEKGFLDSDGLTSEYDAHGNLVPKEKQGFVAEYLNEKGNTESKQFPSKAEADKFLETKLREYQEKVQPLIDHTDEILMKAALKLAKEEGLDGVVVSDPRTAMLTQGHLGEMTTEHGMDAADVREYKNRDSSKDTYTPPSQAAGMTQAYGQKLPKILSKATGHPGEPVELGGRHYGYEDWEPGQLGDPNMGEFPMDEFNKAFPGSDSPSGTFFPVEKIAADRPFEMFTPKQVEVKPQLEAIDLAIDCLLRRVL